jgi:hypothetical protein
MRAAQLSPLANWKGQAMAKGKNATGAAKAKGANVLEVQAEDGEEHEDLFARLALNPGTRHAAVGSNYASGLFGEGHSTPIGASAAVVGTAMAKARAGDKAMASDLLAAQAVVLDTMFTELARRSFVNMGQYIDASDRYMRLALKAQANCRATLEALGKLHQPREQVVKHVHVNQGGQAVVADQFHQHTGGRENEQSNEQPHATGTAGESPALSGPDPIGQAVPVPGCEGESPVPYARRKGQRRAEGQS